MTSVHYFQYTYRLPGQTRWKNIRIRFELRGWKIREWEEVAITFLDGLDYELSHIGRWIEFSCCFRIGQAEGKGVFSRKDIRQAITHVIETLKA
ncbi:MAG: hypothetical protein NUV54_01825 [Candidatus Taylorbacteria bacterium]|nr:hypothetical protein [Candidatus Taylorbacteria bacterium]